MPAMSTQLFHLHIIEEWKKQIDTAAPVLPAGRVWKIQKVQAPSVAGTSSVAEKAAPSQMELVKLEIDKLKQELNVNKQANKANKKQKRAMLHRKR